MTCDWCNKEKGDLKAKEEWGKTYATCEDCNDLVDAEKCVTCKTDLYGEMTIRGECSSCQQVSFSKKEKRRSEVMNGLSDEDFEFHEGQKSLSEDDFEDWMTSSRMNFTPAQKKTARRTWLRFRLLNHYNWTEQEVEENLDDLEYIMVNHSVKLSKSNYIFVLDGDTRVKPYGMILSAVKGKVRLYNTI